MSDISNGIEQNPLQSKELTETDITLRVNKRKAMKTLLETFKKIPGQEIDALEKTF